MLASNFSRKVTEVLQRIASDIIHMEQYMDFLRNRTFRQTLVVHRDRKLRRNITHRDVKEFWIGTAAKPASDAPEVRTDRLEEFLLPNGAKLKSSHPLTKAACLVLAEHWPRPLHFERLCELSRARLDASGAPDLPIDESAVDILAGELLTAHTVGLIELRPRDLPLSLQPATRPVASRLARWLAQQPGQVRVVNLRHEPVTLSELQRQVVQRLDGQHDRQGLLDELVALVRSGAMNVEKDGVKCSEPETLRPLLEGLIAEALPSLAGMALLEA